LGNQGVQGSINCKEEITYRCRRVWEYKLKATVQLEIYAFTGEYEERNR